MTRPRGGVHYPRSVGEFQAWFRTDADCLDYLEWVRWPRGFVCPGCGRSGCWRLGDGRVMCAACGRRTSVTAGTILGKTRKFDKDFREGAVRLVRETGKPIAQVARDLGGNEGTLGNWVNADRRRRGEGDGALSEDERAELARLRKENAELAMRCDVLKRSVALWVQDAMGR